MREPGGSRQNGSWAKQVGTVLAGSSRRRVPGFPEEITVARIALDSRVRRALALLVGLAALGAGALGVLRWFEGARGREVEDKAAPERALGAAPEEARSEERR